MTKMLSLLAICKIVKLISWKIVTGNILNLKEKSFEKLKSEIN